MIIISILLLFHVLLWTYKKEYSNHLFILSFFIILTGIVWLFIFQSELWLNNIWNNDYGSDARYYWNAMVSAYLGEHKYSDFLAPLYVGWGLLVLKLSPSISIFWVKLSNIFLYSLSSNMLYIIIMERLKNLTVRMKIGLLMLTVALSTNGIIIWTVIRNLKETFFIFILISYLFIIDQLFKRLFSKKILFWGLMALLSIGAYFILNKIRPLGGSLAYVLGGGLYLTYNNFIFKRKLKWKNIIFFIILFIIPVLLIIVKKADLVTAFRELYKENLVGSSQENQLNVLSYNNIILFPFVILRFILGPGPIRSLRQLLYQDVFIVSTRTGDILIFLGSILWWLMLIVMLFNSFLSFKKFLVSSKYFLDFLIFCFTFIIAYSYIGGGTGDTRLRSVLYFFSIPFFIISLMTKKMEDKI